jgi:uncharacterized membrane protein YfcA
MGATATLLPWIGLIAAASAFIQAVSGFGFSLFAIPLLAVLIGPLEAVVVATLLSGCLSSGALLVYRRDVNWRVIAKVTVSALLGIPIGLVTADLLPARLLTTLIAVCVILAAVFFGLTQQRSGSAKPRAVTAGLLSGALLTSTGMNGPPLVLSFHRMRMPAREFRASLQAAFAFQDLLAIAGFAIVGRLSGDDVRLAAFLLPLLVVGWALGAVVFNRLSQVFFKRFTLWLLIATGCYTAIRELA